MHVHDSNTGLIPAAHPRDSSGAANGAQRRMPVSFQRSIITVALVMFIVLSLIAFAYVARSVVLPVLLAWVASMTLKPLVRWLHAGRVPTPIAAGLVVTLVVTGTYSGIRP